MINLQSLFSFWLISWLFSSTWWPRASNSFLYTNLSKISDLSILPSVIPYKSLWSTFLSITLLKLVSEALILSLILFLNSVSYSARSLWHSFNAVCTSLTPTLASMCCVSTCLIWSISETGHLSISSFFTYSSEFSILAWSRETCFLCWLTISLIKSAVSSISLFRSSEATRAFSLN